MVNTATTLPQFFLDESIKRASEACQTMIIRETRKCETEEEIIAIHSHVVAGLIVQYLVVIEHLGGSKSAALEILNECVASDIAYVLANPESISKCPEEN